MDHDSTLRIQEQAEHLGHHLPPLQVEADRVAHTVAQGLHGRRKAGTGETFWQYRRYQPGDPASAIDWRKSARADVHFIRENEWEAANTVWIWVDRSDSMRFKSHLADTTKEERATLLGLALASLLMRSGERFGALGSPEQPTTGRTALRRLAAHWLTDVNAEAEKSESLPPNLALARFSNVVLISDFLEPVEEISRRIAGIAGRDIRGHLVQVLDPAEESLPYEGRTEFFAREVAENLVVGRAEALRRGYRQKLLNHKSALAAFAKRLGWTFSVHHTDGSAQAGLLSLYSILSGHLGSADPYVGPDGASETMKPERAP